MLPLLFIALTGVISSPGVYLDSMTGEEIQTITFSQFGYVPDYDPSVGYVDIKGERIYVTTTAMEPFDLYLRVFWQ